MNFLWACIIYNRPKYRKFRNFQSVKIIFHIFESKLNTPCMGNGAKKSAI